MRHCGPTAAVNLIRTLESYEEARKKREQREAGQNGQESSWQTKRRLPDAGGTGLMGPEQLFLTCAEVGHRTHIYWNREILGHFGGTSNPLTGIFLARCMKASGADRLRLSIRQHIRITPEAIEEALRRDSIVYLQVYRHPKYGNHHMLCYGYRYREGKREFLLADGWNPGPVWADDREIGRGHYLTIRCG